MTLAEQAYRRLEEMIVTLALPPGAVFTEGELARRLGIGRTPLREAVQRLASLRLVNTLARRGLSVTAINLTDHLGVLETRKVLDALIAAGAARRATPEQRARLREFAARMEEAARSDDLELFLALDQEFDLLLADAAHNSAAANAIAPLHVHCRRFWYYHRHGGDLLRAARLHEDLINTVCDGDAEGAAAASNVLLEYLEEFTRDALDLYTAPLMNGPSGRTT
jgi:DNA-binding GntR family transcriptional regulator